MGKSHQMSSPFRSQCSLLCDTCVTEEAEVTVSVMQSGGLSKVLQTLVRLIERDTVPTDKRTSCFHIRTGLARVQQEMTALFKG